jgi:hypothetical protein
VLAGGPAIDCIMPPLHRTKSLGTAQKSLTAAWAQTILFFFT